MGNKVSCEEAGANPRAFPESNKFVALNPQDDKDLSKDNYLWEYQQTPEYEILGKDIYHSLWQQTIRAPDADASGLSHQGATAPRFNAKWERDLAYHHGTYVPEKYQPPRTDQDIKMKVEEYSEKVQADAPNDACKYLLIEEYRCLQTNQFEYQPEKAGTSCVKWFDEWQKCKWDQEKFNSGYTHIEGPQLMKKRRPYIFYPDFKYL